MSHPAPIPSKQIAVTYLVVSVVLTILVSWFWYQLMFGDDGNVQIIEWVLLSIPIAVGIVTGRIVGARSEELFLSMGIGYVLAFAGTEMVFLTSDWTTALFLLPVSLIVAVPSAPAAASGFYLAQLLKRSPKRGHCPNCGYNLRGNLKAGCPECGWNRAEPS